MVKNLHVWKVTILLFLLASPLIMRMQISAQQEDIPVNTIVIENPTDFNVQFSLKNRYVNWVSFYLPPLTENRYLKKNQIIFVSNNGLVKQYDLDYRTRYVFGWNQNREFDLFKAPK